MSIFPPTREELMNGYSCEKLNYLKPFVIYNVEKLTIGKKYALATNGYCLGVYEGNTFISHQGCGATCGCHGYLYDFVRTDFREKKVTESRSQEFIVKIGLYEITY